MTDPTFPYGYKKDAAGVAGMGTMLTWNQMMGKATVYNLHPELRERFRALIEYAHSVKIPLGVGTGWRVQPNPPPSGFASPGNSWHESCPVSPSGPSALAIDVVPNKSWPWMEANVAKYGLKTFKYVNNEPWHIQPFEIPNGRKYATVLPPLQNFVLPGQKPPTSSGVFTVQGYRKEVKQGSKGKMALMCQQQINLIAGQGIVEDGDFGSQSVEALKRVQTVLGCGADGVCGQKTWQAFENGIKVQSEAGDWD